MRTGSLAFLSLTMLLFVTLVQKTDDPAAPILSRPIPLDRDRPGPLRVGGLRFLRGWVLHSANREFGGLSSMVADDAGNFLAVSDNGVLFAFRMGPVGLVGPSRIRPLPAPRVDVFDADSESLAVDPATGTAWVGYEHRNRIRRFAPGVTHATGDVQPPAMRRWPLNLGPESMARLDDGRFVVIAEDAPAGGGTTEGVLFSGDPVAPDARAIRFRYRSPAQGYKPTDARQLPDGRLLVLHRRFGLDNGLSAILAVLDPTTIRAGAIVQGQILARLGWPLEVDNMEALAVTREAGRTIVWIASDDNFMPIQRTLLLKFALPG